MNDILHFLKDPSCYRFEKSYFSHLGRYSPYRFATPNPITPQQLNVIGDCLSKIIINHHEKPEPVCLIGIASRGISLAVSTVLKLQENRRDCYFSHVSLRGSFEHVSVKSKQDFVVLVDNAINSGDTLLQVKQTLESTENVKPSLCLSMFDRMEYLEDGTDRSQQENLVGCPIRSAFSLINLIEALEDKYERSSTIEYALDYGNKEILSYLSFRRKKV